MGLKADLSKLAFASALLLSLGVASRASSIPARGASTYGGNEPLSTCEANITAFTSGTSSFASNCEAFEAGTFTIGGSTYSGDIFAYLSPGGTDSGVLDIITLASGGTLSLNLTSLSAPTGIFMCGSFGTSLSTAEDSSDALLTGLSCTSGTSNSLSGYTDTQSFSNITLTPTSTGVQFANNTGSPIAIFAADGTIVGETFSPTTATTPEPASLVLLGTGALALGGLKRKRKQSA